MGRPVSCRSNSTSYLVSHSFRGLGDTVDANTCIKRAVLGRDLLRGSSDVVGDCKFLLML